MIVIEGPDGSGKSTLALNLAKHYQSKVIHGGGPLTDRTDFLERCSNNGWWDEKNPNIFDRVSFISEPVYASLAGRGSLVSLRELQYWVTTVRPVVVFCCLETSKEMVERIFLVPKAHKTPEHMAKVIKEHPIITQKYHDLMSNIPHLNFNYNKNDIRNLITEINHRIL